ncbi:MAG: multidrug effflux MFS transporter [Pseudomonadota bacterium]
MTKKATLTRQEVKILVITIIVAACSMLGIDIHLASMPHIMRYLHTDKTHMQQSVSIYLLGMGASLFFYGPLSDRYGRKPIVIFGLSLAALASYGTMFTHTIVMFLFTRLIQGVGSSVCIGVVRTIIVDVLKKRTALYASYFTMFLGLSPLLAPAIGGYIQHGFDWQANFFVLGSVIALALFVYTVFCPETNHYKNPDACKIKTIYQNYTFLLCHKVFIGCTLLAGIVMAANMAYATTSSFILQTQFNLTPIIYGWTTSIVGIGTIIGKFITPTIIHRFGQPKTVITGLVLLLIAGLWLVLFILFRSINVPLIMIAVIATLLAQAFVGPTIGSAALTPFHDKRGAAGAFYGGFQLLVTFLGSAIIGSFAHDGIWVLAIAYTVLGLLGLIIYRYAVINSFD